MNDFIQHDKLADLIKHNEILTIELVYTPEGYIMRILTTKGDNHTLYARTSAIKPRIFRRIDGAVKYAASLGLEEIKITGLNKNSF